MVQTTRLMAALLAAHFSAVSVSAFGVAKVRTSRPDTARFLEDHIADLIDGELVRLSHLPEWEREWHKKNKAVMEPVAADTGVSMLTVDADNAVQKRRDVKLAERNPQQYCADRCVATGNCEVYEDMFEMSPDEVMAFCTDCVLSDDEEPCDIPESMYGDDGKELTP